MLPAVGADSGHGEIDHCFTPGGQHFVVFTQAAALGEPHKPVFDHSASRKHQEAFARVRAQHGLKQKPTLIPYPVDELPAIGAVDPHSVRVGFGQHAPLATAHDDIQDGMST